MDDINLDFLKTPPKETTKATHCDSPFVGNAAINLGFGRKRNGNKRFEMAKNISKVDELLQEIERLKTQNNELQQQLKDFQTTAQQVQDLYSQEKQEHATAKSSLEKLRKEYQKIDVDLTNKNMVNEQMKARLAEYEGRPIHFNNLVVKYIKIMNKLEGEDILKYSVEKDLMERLREYCNTMNLKIPPINSPKKYKARGGSKVKTEHAFVQCNLMENDKKDCLNCLKKPKMKDQSIQSSTTKHDQATQSINNTKSTLVTATKRDQASQYISTMITRQTNTEKIVQKHVQTMFPEPQKAPAVDDILNVYAKWSNIRSVSPLLESPSRQTREMLKSLKNTGTCTMLCNIRRKIDYLPPNNSSNIKQEIITPSASPTPNSLPLTTNRNRMSSMSDSNTSQFNNTILNLFNTTQNSALGQLSSNAFNELWQIFGKMLLSLLQTSNAGIANTNAQNSTINQQQFLDWLLELYMDSQTQNHSSTTQTHTGVQTSDANISTSPLCFNDSSILSANVVRPQAQKSLPVNRNSTGEANNVTESTHTLQTNTSITLDYQQNSITNTLPILYNSTNLSNLEDSYSQDSNSMDIEVKQIQSTTNKKQQNEPTQNPKTKNKLLSEIQELIPELKLDKMKRKALKRLLKKTNNRKKKFDLEKQKTSKTSIQMNNHNENVENNTAEAEQEYNEKSNPESSLELREEIPLETAEEEETAVDFLKTFVMETCSQTEQLYCQQSSTNVDGKNPNTDFNFIKPTNTIPRIKSITNTKSRTKHKKSKINNKKIENKLQLLFGGDSDSELEAQEQNSKADSVLEEQDYEQNSKAVIINSINLNENLSQTIVNKQITNINDNTLEYNENWQQQQSMVNSTNCFEIENNYSTKSCHLTLRDITKTQQNSLPTITSPIFENSFGFDVSKERFSIPELRTPVLKSLENSYFPEIFQCTKDFKQIEVDSSSIAESLRSEVEQQDFKEIPKLKENPNKTSSNDIENNKNSDKLKQTFESKEFQNKTSKDDIEEDKIFESLDEDGENYENHKTFESNCNEYPSDFENDFELSSENESEPEQDSKNNVDSETLAKTLSSNNNLEILHNNVSSKEQEKHDFELSSDNESEPEEDSKNSVDCEKFSKTLSSNNNLEIQHKDVSLKETETYEENVKSLEEHDTTFKSNVEYSSDIENDLELSSDNESVISEAEQHSNYETPIKTLSSNNKLEIVQKDVSLKETGKHEENLKSLEKEENTNSLRNCENKIVIENKKYCEENWNNLQETKQEIFQNSSENLNDTCTSTSFQKDLLNSSANGSLTNQIESKDNSLCWSVITITDTSSMNGTESSFNNKELMKCKENKNNNLETANKTKTSGLSSLKLLDLNTIAKSSKNLEQSKEVKENSYNSNNTTSISTIDLQTKPKQQLSIIPEHNQENTTSISTIDLQTKPKQQLSIIPEHNESLLNNDTITDCSDEENELIIDDEPNETTNKSPNTSQQSTDIDISIDNLNTSNISTLLNSSLYNEVLTESFNPIVDDLLNEDEDNLRNTNLTPEITKSRRGRKRKSETTPELTQPCKRSQRLQAKQMVLEESLNISKTPKELSKYTRSRRNNLIEMKEISKEEDEQKKARKITRSENVQTEKETEIKQQISEETIKDKTTNSKYFNNNSSLNDGPSLTTRNSKCKEPFNNFVYTDSPQSPPPLETANESNTQQQIVNIPTERLPQFIPLENNQTLLDNLINSYRYENQKHVSQTLNTKERQKQNDILAQLHKHLKKYCYSNMELDEDCTSQRLINKLLSISCDYKLIQKALINITENAESCNVPEKDLPSIIQEMPPRHMAKCLQRLFPVLRNIIKKNSLFCQELIERIECLLFNSQQTERISLQGCHNLTQLYLMSCKIQESIEITKHSARLFIAKCLYFYIIKAPKMIHEVLMWYPTVLPHREDKTYDRSDALISVLQHLLMNTKYEMDKPELHGKILLSKLRYEYHFEPYKPSLEEIVNVLVEKLKNSKFYNISLAFGLLCKRLGIVKTQIILLNQHLLPLANEYYNLAMKSNDHDKCIAVLLEIISMIVKPFPHETDTKIYFKEFARFLNAFERPVIQEAALCSILRLQRFNMSYCYNLLKDFKPTFDLDTHTQAMLNTFIYRRPLTYWKNLKSQNPIDLN